MKVLKMSNSLLCSMYGMPTCFPPTLALQAPSVLCSWEHPAGSSSDSHTQKESAVAQLSFPGHGTPLPALSLLPSNPTNNALFPPAANNFKIAFPLQALQCSSHRPNYYPLGSRSSPADPLPPSPKFKQDERTNSTGSDFAGFVVHRENPYLTRRSARNFNIFLEARSPVQPQRSHQPPCCYHPSEKEVLGSNS